MEKEEGQGWVGWYRLFIAGKIKILYVSVCTLNNPSPFYVGPIFLCTLCGLGCWNLLVTVIPVSCLPCLAAPVVRAPGGARDEPASRYPVTRQTQAKYLD